MSPGWAALSRRGWGTGCPDGDPDWDHGRPSLVISRTRNVPTGHLFRLVRLLLYLVVGIDEEAGRAAFVEAMGMRRSITIGWMVFTFASAQTMGCGNGDLTSRDGATEATDGDTAPLADGSAVADGSDLEDTGLPMSPTDDGGARDADAMAGVDGGVPPEPAPMPFFLKLTTTGSGSLRAVVELADGDFLATGQTPNDPGFDLWLVRVSPSGDLRWQKQIDVDVYDDGTAIVATASGGAYVVGSTSHLGGPTRDAVVLSIGDDGTIRWARRIGDDSDDVAQSVALTSAGDLLVGGSSQQAWLARMTPGGDVLWQRHLRKPARVVASITGLFESPGGEITAAVTSAERWGLRDDSALLHLDAFGGIIAQRDLRGIADPEIHQVVPLSDTGILWVGRDDFGSFALKTSPALAIVWSASFPTSGILGADETATGDVLLGGWARGASSGSVSSFVASLNRGATPIMSRTLVATGRYHTMQRLLVDSGGAMVAVGTDILRDAGGRETEHNSWVYRSPAMGIGATCDLERALGPTPIDRDLTLEDVLIPFVASMNDLTVAPLSIVAEPGGASVERTCS